MVNRRKEDVHPSEGRNPAPVDDLDERTPGTRRLQDLGPRDPGSRADHGTPPPEAAVGQSVHAPPHIERRTLAVPELLR